MTEPIDPMPPEEAADYDLDERAERMGIEDATYIRYAKRLELDSADDAEVIEALKKESDDMGKYIVECRELRELWEAAEKRGDELREALQFCCNFANELSECLPGSYLNVSRKYKHLFGAKGEGE